MIPQDSFCPELSPTLRSILWNRGFRTADEVERFLNPRLSDIPSPHDQLLDLREAIQILLSSRDRKEPIVVLGDYDVDGSTSTALLVRVLRDWGFIVDFYIPHRINEGYGLTVKAADGLLKKFPKGKVVVTCDNGIGSFEGVEFLKSKGLKVIITDHHEVPERRVPADAVINPKQRNCPYPDKKLAGVGVAFLFLLGLRRALEAADYPLAQYLDLVAVGTVCDVAELKGVNRVIAKMGLARLQDSRFPGLRLLAKRCPSYPKRPSSRDLGFFIGPRLNASGRVGVPDLGARSLLAQSEAEALPLIDELERENQKRKSLQEAQVALAEVMAEKIIRQDPQRTSLVISDEGFHLGIVGLIASRLSEKFQKPACVLTRVVDEHELAMSPLARGLWKGSLRAPVGYHLAAALEVLKSEAPGLLVSGGGHAQAAGVGLEEENRDVFGNLFERALSKQIVSNVDVHADAELKSADGLEEILEVLEPFGQGNPPPLLLVKGMRVERASIMKDVHLKFWGRAVGRNWAVLQFKSPWVNMIPGWVREGLEIDLLVELQENEWNGRRDLELLLKEVVGLRVNGEGRDVIQGRHLRTNEVLQAKGVQ